MSRNAAAVVAFLLLAGLLAAAQDGEATVDAIRITSHEEGELVTGPTTIAGQLIGLDLGGAPGASEDYPLRSDEAGDGLLADLSNVWIPRDNGTAFDVHLRVHGANPAPSVNPAAETTYMVEFTHDGIRYGVGASEFLVAGYDGASLDFHYEYALWLKAGENWCRHAPLEGTHDDGVFGITVPYGLLDVAEQPTDVFFDSAFIGFLLYPYDACFPSPVPTGPAAAVGDLLEDFHARHWPQAGPGEFLLLRGDALGDESAGNATMPYRLGVGGIPQNASGANLVDITVGRELVAQASPAFDGNWSAEVDFGIIYPDRSCVFQVQAAYGGVTERVRLVYDGCEPAKPEARTHTPRPHAADTGFRDTSVQAPPPAEEPTPLPPDRSGDGVPDHLDNCPDHSNPDQTDSNGNGMGDVCDPYLGLGLFGDGPDDDAAEGAGADGAGAGGADDATEPTGSGAQSTADASGASPLLFVLLAVAAVVVVAGVVLVAMRRRGP